MKSAPRPILFPLLLTAALVALAPQLAAQDLSGSWNMDTTANLPDEVSPCIYSGDCEMQQTGSSLAGTVVLGLVSGPASCPAEMTATIEGTVDDDDVFGTLLGGQLGTASFEGTRSNSFVGTFSAGEGPFNGGQGSWLALRPSVLEIPTASATGLILLVLMLLLGGTWLLRSERRTA